MDNYVRLLNYLNDGPNTFEWPLDYTVVALRALGMTSASVSSTSVKIAFGKVLRRAKVLRGKVKPKWDTLPRMDFGHGRSNKMGMTPRKWQFLCRAAKPRVSTRCMAIFVLLCGQVYGLLTNWANRSVQMSNARTILTQPAAIEEWELLAFTVVHFATGMIGLRKDLVKKLVCTFDLPAESRQC